MACLIVYLFIANVRYASGKRNESAKERENVNLESPLDCGTKTKHKFPILCLIRVVRNALCKVPPSPLLSVPRYSKRSNLSTSRGYTSNILRCGVTKSDKHPCKLISGLDELRESQSSYFDLCQPVAPMIEKHFNC